ncbi:Replicase RepFR55, partial [Bacillus pseudomycoides]
VAPEDCIGSALRMPKKIDRYQRWDFEKCVEWFEYNQAEISNPAHFMKMYTEKTKQRNKRNANEAREALTNMAHEPKYERKLPIIDWLNSKKMDSVLQKMGVLKS